MITHKKVYAPSIKLIENYVQKKGWALFTENAYNKIWGHRTGGILYMPKEESGIDYESKIEVILIILSSVEDRDSYDIWQDITWSHWANE